MWASALLIAACSPKITETITIRETQTVHDTITLRDSVTLINERVQVEVVRLPGNVYTFAERAKEIRSACTKTIKEVAKPSTKTEKAAMWLLEF
jgi:hypothetical protein